ncbi:ER-associated protein degradation protein [Pseudoscourfieldia marina]
MALLQSSSSKPSFLLGKKASSSCFRRFCYGNRRRRSLLAASASASSASSASSLADVVVLSDVPAVDAPSTASSASASAGEVRMPYAQRKALERGESLRRSPNEKAWVKTVNLSVEHRDNGSWVRTDGNILIPGNAEDFKTWATDPYMSGDDQILISATAVILASTAREQGWLPPKVSAAILTGVKILSVVWISVYWGADYLTY